MSLKIYPWPNGPVKRGLDLVREVVLAEKALSSKGIFKAIHKDDPRKPSLNPRTQKVNPEPLYPDHPVRSLSYLKTVLLPALERRREVERFQSKPGAVPNELKGKSGSKQVSRKKDERRWLWRPVNPAVLERQKQAIQTIEEKRAQRRAWGVEVGRGTDWDHLNKRRRRSRMEKVERDMRTYKEIMALKKEVEGAGGLVPTDSEEQSQTA